MGLKCDNCGREFTSTRADARYCSGRCRTIAYRVRRDGEKPKRPRRPLPDAVFGQVYGLRKVLYSLDQLTTDDRFPRFSRDHPRARSVASDLERAAMALDKIRTQFPSVTPD